MYHVMQDDSVLFVGLATTCPEREDSPETINIYLYTLSLVLIRRLVKVNKP
jgi:hypothetical protein